MCGTILRSQSFLVARPSEQRGGPVLRSRAARQGARQGRDGPSPLQELGPSRLECGSFQFAFLSVWTLS